MSVSEPPPREPSPFAFRDYRYFWLMRLSFTMASTMLVVVIGWQVYSIARETMDLKQAAFLLGMIGLVQFIPLFLLTPVSGYVADRMDRRLIVRLSLLVELVCAAVLALLVWQNAMTLAALFAVSVGLGVARAFAGPALSSFAPNIVPPAVLPTAIAWSSIAWQSGAVLGPPIGGFLYAEAPVIPHATASALLTVSLMMSMLICRIPRGNAGDSHPLRAIVDGLRYVRDNRIVLGAISLDLFAVLLGGAVAMLPVYARDVLHVGSEGLGQLRAAPAVGAALTALFLTQRPIRVKVGIKMFAGVGLFGLATIVFGLSTQMWLSLASLVLLGVGDMVSVYIRSSLIQLHTPDAMRGRVSAVSGLFISASNELGEFESGVTAAWFGPVEAVVAGGVGALIVTAIYAWRFPELRLADRFATPEPKPPD